MIMGVLQKDTQGLGIDRVSGRRRVPNPPTSTKAFIWLYKAKIESVAGVKDNE